MQGWIVGLVLGSALMHAIWNVMMKVGNDRWLTMAIISTTSMIGGFFLAITHAFPSGESWIFIGISTGLHLLYKTSLVFAYRHWDLGQVYPLSRGSAPVFLMAFASISEGLPDREALIGIGLISVGVASLSLGRGRGLKRIYGAGFAFWVGLLIASYTLANGLGVRVSGSDFGYIGWFFILDGVPWSIWLGWRIFGSGRALPPGDLVSGVIAGLLSAASYGSVVWALGQGGLAMVAALRETSVVFATIISAWKLNESFGVRRLLAASLVAAGVVLINI